jgi:hypothetical protein
MEQNTNKRFIFYFPYIFSLSEEEMTHETVGLDFTPGNDNLPPIT